MLKEAKRDALQRRKEVKHYIETNGCNFAVQKKLIRHLNELYSLRLHISAINILSAGMGDKKLDYCFPINLAEETLLSDIFSKQGNSTKLLIELSKEYNYYQELLEWKKNDYSKTTTDENIIRDKLCLKMLNRTFQKEVDWYNDKILIGEKFIPELKSKKSNMKRQVKLKAAIITVLSVVTTFFVANIIYINSIPSTFSGGHILGYGVLINLVIYSVICIVLILVLSNLKNKELGKILKHYNLLDKFNIIKLIKLFI